MISVRYFSGIAVGGPADGDGITADRHWTGVLKGHDAADGHYEWRNSAWYWSTGTYPAISPEDTRPFSSARYQPQLKSGEPNPDYPGRANRTGEGQS